MSQYIAVEGMTLAIVEGSPTTVLGTISIIGSPSTINRINNNGVYLDGLEVSVTNITSPEGGATTADPGPVTGYINASVSKVKENGTLVLVNGDETDILNATPQIPGSPKPTDYPVTFRVRIINSNNTKVEAK